MVMLVTLDEASFHLRRDTSDDDADLTLKIKAASGAVMNYLKVSGNAYVSHVDSDGQTVFELDTDGQRIPKDEVRNAVLLLVGDFYRNRDPAGGNFQPGYLPPAVTALLYPLRDPALR